MGYACICSENIQSNMLKHHRVSSCLLQVSVIEVDGLLQLPNLSCLDLQNNSISQVPPQLGTVTTLKYVRLICMYFSRPVRGYSPPVL